MVKTQQVSKAQYTQGLLEGRIALHNTAALAHERAKVAHYKAAEASKQVSIAQAFDGGLDNMLHDDLFEAEMDAMKEAKKLSKKARQATLQCGWTDANMITDTTTWFAQALNDVPSGEQAQHLEEFVAAWHSEIAHLHSQAYYILTRFHRILGTFEDNL